MRLLIISATLALAVGFAAAEDRLLLKDGQVVTGKILSMSDSDVQIESGDETMRVPRWAIDKIEKDGKEVADKATTKRGKRQAPRRGAPARLPATREHEKSAELLAWIDLCVKHLGSTDPGVTAGAAAALRNAGGAALPALQGALDSGKQPLAGKAERLITQIGRIEDSRFTASADRIDRMARDLELSDDQTPKFREILEDFQSRQGDISKSVRTKDVDIADAGKQIRALREERDAKLATVLNAKQLAAFKEMTPRPSGREASRR